ncbi:MAG TPA: transporter substrate-binding domain-containing protein [Candidatus Mediterraneibacter merdipullorum]|nr:transporter substrate-binding domain-containing protein [Candidatus Mediterraneibacter merdipullorum]
MKGTMRKRAALTAALALAAGLLAGGCGGEKSSGTLRVGVRDDIMNFGYLNETTGKYYGLEIDIAAEMAERMGYSDVEYVTVTPDTRKDMLLAGDVDCVVATYSIADTRLENFDFSDPYYTDRTVVVVEKSTLIEDIYDLKGLNIGTMAGANASPLLATKLFELGIIGENVISNTDTFTQYEGVSVTKAPSYQDLDVLLEQGRVDAACMDECIAQTYMDSDRMFLEEEIAYQNYGVATKKDSELSGEVKAAIREMLDDGTIDRLISKWDWEK